MADGSILKWLIIIAGLMIIFNVLGVTTTSGVIVDELFNNFQNFKLSNFFDTIEDGIIAGAVGGTIVVGLLFRRSPESALLVPYASLLLTFVADIITIYQTAQNTGAPWVGNIAAILLIPIAIGYGHAVISWWSQR